MSLFKCSLCHCIENTGSGWYHCWDTQRLKFDVRYHNVGPVCSECGPATYPDGTPTKYQGKWHNRFPKRHAVGMYVDNRGLLYYKDTGLRPGSEIVGIIDFNGNVKPLNIQIVIKD